MAPGRNGGGSALKQLGRSSRRPQTPTKKNDRRDWYSRRPANTERESMPTLVNNLRQAAQVLEDMAIGAVNLASQRSTDSPFSADSPAQQQRLLEQLQERKSYIFDAGQNVQIAQVLHILADRAEAAEVTPVAVDRGEILASALDDAAQEYSDRLDRIQDFVLGFKNVPGAEKWWESVGMPIVKMAAGQKL